MTSSYQYASQRESIWEGRRVRLRAVEPNEWPKFRDADQLTPDQRFGDRVHPPRSIAGYEKWAAEMAVTPPNGDEFWLVIAEIESNKAVGSICTVKTDTAAGVFWYGLGVFRSYQRRGYGSEAIRIVQRYMFGERRYQKCQAEVYGDNGPSLGLHQSLGFVQEGRLRKAIFHDGTYQDRVIFGMTVDEFRNLR